MQVVEPELLRRGKEFHRLVQASWAGEIEKATVRPEHSILFHTASSLIERNRRGRLDIFVDRIDDFVTVVEIKSTNWDRIPIANRRRLLAAHRRQVLRYVDEFLDEQHVNPPSIRQIDVRGTMPNEWCECDYPEDALQFFTNSVRRGESITTPPRLELANVPSRTTADLNRKRISHSRLSISRMSSSAEIVSPRSHSAID
jgi:hypothetical protein